jgi:flagellar biosynthetic protein FliR
MTIRLLPEVAVLYMLAFARIGAIAMLLPGIGETAVSPRIRLALALFLALALHPITAPLYPTGLAAQPAKLSVFLGGEIAIGLFIGMVSRLVLAGAQVAGTTIANQLGLGFAMTVDPTQGQQGVIFGNFLSLTAVTLIFVTDLHVPAITAVSSSFTLFPPGQCVPVGDFAETTVQLVGEAFKVGQIGRASCRERVS